jgi:hypothetical protein
VPPSAGSGVPAGTRHRRQALRTIAPDETRGNLDVEQLTVGATFCLPVYRSDPVIGRAMGPEATFDPAWDGKVAISSKACALEISNWLGFVPTAFAA